MIKNTFEEHILMGRLPSSQRVALRLVELARQKEPSNAEIAAAIKIDPALTGRVLERASLLPAATSGPIESVEVAIESLGSRELLVAVRDLSLITADGSRRCPGFDYDGFWASSLSCAVAAERIARSTGCCPPESAYTLGLLSEIGRLALASVYPKEYSSILATEGGRDPVTLARLEREHLEIDHGTVTACVLEHWGLRKSFARASSIFEDPSRVGETEDAETLHFVNVLRCAHLLAQEYIEESASPASAGVHRGLAMLRTALSLSDEAARAVSEDVTRRLGEISTGARASESRSAESEPRSAAEAKTRSAPALHERRGLRILAVDDDPTSLVLLRRVLQAEGHDVRCARDGAEAFQIALESDLQAVVADWMMPRMDGIELCKALRCIQSGRELFFLLLTGRDTEDQIVEAYDAGVDEYVTKPFNPRILLARLRAGQRIIELKREVDAERQVVAQQVRELGLLNRRLNTAALTDPLTGLPNRRSVWERLAEEWHVPAPLSAMMIDLDAFKKVNDRYGHEMGDLVLKQIAGVLRLHARHGEDVSRLGGEEFLVLCPNTTQAQALTGAERLRVAVEAHVIRAPGFIEHMTVSIGVAERTPDMESIDALLKAADDAVYAAKSAGRNQVKLSERRRGEALSA